VAQGETKSPTKKKMTDENARETADSRDHCDAERFGEKQNHRGGKTTVQKIGAGHIR